MITFRITTTKWSKSLTASGIASRWCAKGRLMIYTAESRALACLENLVHRSGEGDNNLYKVMCIEIPEKLKIEVLDINDLKKDWFKIQNYHYCQNIGSNWLDENKTAILKVPSAIIKNEFNYLLNPNHIAFSKIKLIAIEDFDFDKRV